VFAEEATKRIPFLFEVENGGKRKVIVPKGLIESGEQAEELIVWRTQIHGGLLLYAVKEVQMIVRYQGLL